MRGRKVGRAGRVLDVVGLVLLLVGAAMAARAWLGFQEVEAYQPAFAEAPFAALRLHDRYARLQRGGTVVMVAGMAVFVAAWWVGRRTGEGEAG